MDLVYEYKDLEVVLYIEINPREDYSYDGINVGSPELYEDIGRELVGEVDRYETNGYSLTVYAKAEYRGGLDRLVKRVLKQAESVVKDYMSEEEEGESTLLSALSSFPAVYRVEAKPYFEYKYASNLSR